MSSTKILAIINECPVQMYTVSYILYQEPKQYSLKSYIHTNTLTEKKGNVPYKERSKESRLIQADQN